MTIFDILRYPVDANTRDFDHVPNRIWKAYMKKYHVLVDDDELMHEYNTNEILIKMIREWEDPDEPV